MKSTITRDFVVKDGTAKFTMKEYPNYCGIADIGYIAPTNTWSDAHLEYKGKIYNEHVISDVMYDRFVDKYPEKDGDYEAFNQYISDNKDEVYELIESAD